LDADEAVMRRHNLPRPDGGGRQISICGWWLLLGLGASGGGAEQPGDVRRGVVDQPQDRVVLTELQVPAQEGGHEPSGVAKVEAAAEGRVGDVAAELLGRGGAAHEGGRVGVRHYLEEKVERKPRVFAPPCPWSLPARTGKDGGVCHGSIHHKLDRWRWRCFLR
jgi:hypothetical protein